LKYRQIFDLEDSLKRLYAVACLLELRGKIIFCDGEEERTWGDKAEVGVFFKYESGGGAGQRNRGRMEEKKASVRR
jgi:hypothetical protein